MKRLNILTWHIHGSYLNSITQVDHNWYLPVNESYGGRTANINWPPYVRDVPADQVRDLDLDLIIFQSPKNYEQDQYEILSETQRRLPRIYLEHNTPRPHPTDTKHLIDDPAMLLVHVTQFNRLMWDNNRTPTITIEHSVALDPALRWSGERPEAITVINEIVRRGRIAGYDLWQQARQQVPLTLTGIGADKLGGIGDIPYSQLHRRVAEYRTLFSPMRYTSLPLAVIEALTIGMPVVALATTELPTVIENGVTGYVSCDPAELIDRLRELIEDHDLARRIGANGREMALDRFGLDRFRRDWNNAFAHFGF